MAGYFNPNRAAAGFWWGILVVAAHQLNVKGIGLMFGGWRSVQNKCNKQCTEDRASHKAQRVELYKSDEQSKVRI